MTQNTAAPPATEKLLRHRQRQKLIEACISALHLHGPSRTTIDKVVGIADMSPGIVNFYFETKAALLLAALDHLAVEFEERVLAPLQAMRDDPVAALRRLVELYLDPDIASPRKVSVWYSFWGEANSRREYLEICGKRDVAFGDLVRDLVGRLIGAAGITHLDADAVALGLIGVLEMTWQDIAFHEEADLDRPAARRRCLAYLRSVFPAEFAAGKAQMPGRPNAGAAETGTFGEQAYAMLVAAELTLAGVPAISVPDHWRGYNVLAQPTGRPPQRIMVSAVSSPAGASVIAYSDSDAFDWLAVVLPRPASTGQRRIFIVPRAVADAQIRPCAEECESNLPAFGRKTVLDMLSPYENNFGLSEWRPTRRRRVPPPNI